MDWMIGMATIAALCLYTTVARAEIRKVDAAGLGIAVVARRPLIRRVDASACTPCDERRRFRMKSGSSPVAWQIVSKSKGPSVEARNHASISLKSRLPRAVGTAA